MGPDTRLHLIVLFGGQSAEHDISCVTAAHVLRAIDPARYRITPIGIGRDGTWMRSASTAAALAEGPGALPGTLDPEGDVVAPSEVLVPAADTVVVPLLHGPLGEDGTVQGLLELAGLPYVGSGVLGSALCMDKVAAKSMTAHAGIPQPRHVGLRADAIGPTTPDALVAELGLPLFVKPANMGSSIGVSKAASIEEVRRAIEVALGYDEWIVAEEAIRGREIEVAVLGDLEPRASLAGEIIPGGEFYDYADKYLDERSQAIVPADLTASQSAEVQSLAVRAFTALRCSGLARVDFFFEADGRGFLLNEVNTMPGFTPISMYPKLWVASGLPYPALIDELVRLALGRHARQRRNTSR